MSETKGLRQGLGFEPTSVRSNGVITVGTWILAPDGRMYQYFWCQRWEVLTDQQLPVDGFRSSERWQLFAVSAEGKPVAVFPGCQVKGWLACEQPPNNPGVYCFESNQPTAGA